MSVAAPSATGPVETTAAEGGDGVPSRLGTDTSTLTVTDSSLVAATDDGDVADGGEPVAVRQLNSC